PMSPNTVTDVPKDDVIRPSMYVMFSGTGSGIEQTNTLIPEIVAAGYDVYVPESAILYGDVSEENIPLVKVTSDPNITGNPLVTKGLARWGFGTIWDDINEGKGIDSPPHPHDEDREIIENGLTIRALEIGEML